MLSNGYFLAKFRFDRAENEPAKNLQNVANFANLRTVGLLPRGRGRRREPVPEARLKGGARGRRPGAGAARA